MTMEEFIRKAFREHGENIFEVNPWLTELLVQVEIWKDIPGFEYYQASTFGRIRSKRREVDNPFGTKISKMYKAINV